MAGILAQINEARTLSKPDQQSHDRAYQNIWPKGRFDS